MKARNPLFNWIMKYRKTLLIVVGNLVALFILLLQADAQDPQGYIYGRVITYDNQYEGRIRWGREEVFWNDYFNASKTSSNKYEAYREKNQKERGTSWTDFNWDFKSIWEDRSGVIHQFSCQFGDIRTITDINRNQLTLELKNGERIQLDGNGYNDVGTKLLVEDKEIGSVTLNWDRIRRVEFIPTPKSLNIASSPPIYGTVETFRKGAFTGFIQWDHDERVGEDQLDGDTRDGDISFPFREIRSITKARSGANVLLHSGREFYLTNSNDVNSENRGIIVTVPGVGKIDIPWKYFENVTLEKAPDSGPAYAAYSSPKGLQGKLFTVEGDELTGRMIYDLDEVWEIEALEGKDDDIEYVIAFRDIKQIKPKNYHYSQITLKNGDVLLLGEGRDVSDQNDGILLYEGGQPEPVYVPWSQVLEIIFD